MRGPKIQNKIGGSVFTLPLCALLTAALWWFPQGSYSPSYLVCLLLCALTTYIIMETNSEYALIRVRSRMVSAVWLVLMGCIGLLHEFSPTAISACCLAGSYYVLFRTYQQHQPVFDTFHTFLLLGLGCIFTPALSAVTIFYYWYLLVFMRALTFRGIWAGLIGLLLPFWFWAGYCLWINSFQPMQDWWHTLTTLVPITPEAYLSVPHPLALCWIGVTLLAIYTGLQYLSNSFNDKIRVRMMFYIYIFQSTLILLVAALQPQHAESLLVLMVVSSSPFIAHYFTLTQTWWCTLMFWLGLLIVAALGIVTLTPWATPYINYLTLK